jgi:hypothetical protein
LIGLSACATTSETPPPAAAPTTPEAKSALVTQRVMSRWDDLIKDDLDAAYKYMSPGSREATSLDRFKANTRRNAFRAIKIETVSCEGDACLVRLQLTYDHPKMKGITTPVVESWIIDAGQAWYVYGAR